MPLLFSSSSAFSCSDPLGLWEKNYQNKKDDRENGETNKRRMRSESEFYSYE
jgi:hypothetical protein